jgi:hypothetical protein
MQNYGNASEMQVVGNGSLTVQLEREPINVEVQFLGHPKTIPCNPKHDTLSWDIKKVVARSRVKWTLEVRWSVVDERTIEYIITY